MDTVKPSASEQLRSKAKKLEMLASLLDDGEIASELAGLFQSAPTPEHAARPHISLNTKPLIARVTARPVRPNSAPKRRKRGLEPAAVETVKRAGTPMTAKAVT